MISLSLVFTSPSASFPFLDMRDETAEVRDWNDYGEIRIRKTRESIERSNIFSVGLKPREGVVQESIKILLEGSTFAQQFVPTGRNFLPSPLA